MEYDIAETQDDIRQMQEIADNDLTTQTKDKQ